MGMSRINFRKDLDIANKLEFDGFSDYTGGFILLPPPNTHTHTKGSFMIIKS